MGGVSPLWQELSEDLRQLLDDSQTGNCSFESQCSNSECHQTVVGRRDFSVSHTPYSVRSQMSRCLIRRVKVGWTSKESLLPQPVQNALLLRLISPQPEQRR